MSADGGTAAVGGSADDSAGAVWIFVRANGTWVQQGSKLLGTGAQGNSSQGISMALSSDGNTLAVGGATDNSSAGAVWIFTRSAGFWNQQGPKLTGTGAVGNAGQGQSVALSADGNTLLSGGPSDANGLGATWVFNRSSGGNWTQTGSKLVGSGAIAGNGFPFEGLAVALSGDGATALIEAPGDNSSAGAAWFFIFSNGTWTQQGPKLAMSGGLRGSEDSNSAALSADGNTAAIGLPFSNIVLIGVQTAATGSVAIFTRSNGEWVQQGPSLIGTGAASPALQGSSVSLSADGNTLLEGGPADNSGAGASWIFKRSGTSWTQIGSKIVASDVTGSAFQGASVALSADAGTVLVGGPNDNNHAGAAWAFRDSSAAADIPYLSSQTPGAIRNNFTGFAGLSFTVGSSPLRVSSLGRIYAPGNSGTHTLKLVVASTGVDVPGSSVSLSMMGGTVGQYKYASLTNHIVLQANTQYYLGSQEMAGGDRWYDYGPVTSTDDAVENGPAYYDGVRYVVVSTLPNWAYVPVNFLYSLTASTPVTITINSPQTGATVFGNNVPVTVTTSGPVTSVQLQLNGQNVGIASTASPFTTTLDTASISDSAYPLTAVALDAQGNPTSSQVVWIAINNASIAIPAAFVKSQTPGAARNNFSGFVGFAFSSPRTLTINSLGRLYVPGNSRTHTLKIVQVNGNSFTDVANGSVSVSMSAGTAGKYNYATLPVPLTLSPNTTYYVLSLETNTGDQWYDFGPILTTNNALVQGPAYLDISSRANNYVVVSNLPNYAYGPVNFSYSVGAPALPLSISITTTSSSYVDAGSVPISVSTTGPVTSTQLLINGQKVGAASTTPPYTLSFDTSVLSSGIYLLSALASDSNGNTAYAPTVQLLIRNTFTTGLTPYLSQSPSSLLRLRNDFTGFVGFAFTTGATPITIFSLGRFDTNGLGGYSHLVKLVEASSGLDVPSGSVSVPLTGAITGSYTYAALPSPLTLRANTAYYVVSEEVTGRDSWYDVAFFFPPPNAGTISGPVYLDTTSPGNRYTVVSSIPNYSYGGPNFLFSFENQSGITLVAGQTPGTARNNFTGFVGFALAVGSNPISISSLGRFDLNGNTGNHLLKLVQASNNADVPGGSVAVLMAGGTPGQYKYGALATPVTLAANTTYYLLSLETSGGDQWYDYGPITAASAVAVKGPAYLDTGSITNPYNVVTTLPNYAYGPVNLIYR